MRLYEFKSKNGGIDVIVTTDGIGNQKRVFVTETPSGKGYSIPGSIPEKWSEINSMGFNFVNGVGYSHQDFVDFAVKNKLALTQWSEGFGELTPKILTTTEGFYQYKIETDHSILFAKIGETITPVVTSTKELIVDGIPSGVTTPVEYKLQITEHSGSDFSIVNEKSIKATANDTSLVRRGRAIVIQAESDDLFGITLTQGA